MGRIATLGHFEYEYREAEYEYDYEQSIGPKCSIGRVCLVESLLIALGQSELFVRKPA